MKNKKNKSLLSKIDKPLFFTSVIYSILGIFLILSASSVSAILRYGEPSIYSFAIKQLVFVFVTLLGSLLFVIRIHTKNYKVAARIGLITVFLLLIYLIIYGTINNGIIAWIDLKYFSMQPAEFAKVIIIVYLGVFYQRFLDKPHKKWSFFIPIGISALIAIIVTLLGDFGTGAIIAMIVFFVFLSLPTKEKHIKTVKLIASIIAVSCIVLLVFGGKLLDNSFFRNLLGDMRVDRLNYKNPCDRYLDRTGYQVCNGYIAMSNGGIKGLGIGASKQKYLYLPESHTDFIFPILVEELGVVVGIVVIFGYAFIGYRILKTAKECFNIRNSIICYGVFIYFVCHIILNLGGVLSLIPLTGVPLPFLSYGGSYATSLIVSIFIVLRIHIENYDSKRSIN